MRRENGKIQKVLHRYAGMMTLLLVSTGAMWWSLDELGTSTRHRQTPTHGTQRNERTATSVMGLLADMHVCWADLHVE